MPGGNGFPRGLMKADLDHDGPGCQLRLRRFPFRQIFFPLPEGQQKTDLHF